MHLHTAAPNTMLCPGDPRPDPLQGKISPDIQPDPRPERLKAISPHPVAATGVHRPTLTSPQPPFRSCGSNEVSIKAWEMCPWAVQRDRVEKRVSVFKPGACLGHGTVCCPSPCVHPLCTSARCYPRSAGPISLPTSALFRPGLNALRPCSAITLTTPFCRPRMWAPYIDRPPIQPQPALSEPAPPPPPRQHIPFPAGSQWYRPGSPRPHSTQRYAPSLSPPLSRRDGACRACVVCGRRSAGQCLQLRSAAGRAGPRASDQSRAALPPRYGSVGARALMYCVMSERGLPRKAKKCVLCVAVVAL